MEEERRPGGRRERSRPSKAAFTPPEEAPAPAPPPGRPPPASRPAPSVLFQAPELPDEPSPDEPSRQARPAKRTSPDAAADTPARARPVERATADKPTSEAAARERPANRTTDDGPPSESETQDAGGQMPAVPVAKAPRKAAPKKAATKTAKKAAKTTARKTAAVTTSTSGRKAVAAVSGPVLARTKAEDGPAARPGLLDRPGHAPELLALAAVRAIGPQARDWVAQTRATYPAATADGLARLATRRFVRMAGAGGAASGAFGLLTPAAELTATVWAQAAVVLHLAAAYGRDPLEAERAVDLLVLVGVHPSPEVARAALAKATAADADVDGPQALRAAEAAWRLAMLSSQARGWLAVRMVARRLLPVMVPVAAAAGVAAAVERLAYRARAHYRAA